MSLETECTGRSIVAFFGDTHGGHKLGLLSPGVTLYDEDEAGNLTPYTPELTATQKYLWRIYNEDVESVIRLADGDRIILFHVGDLTQGDWYKDQLVSTRMADQIIIAAANVSPWLDYDNVEAVRLVTGTGSHVFRESSSPILVAEMLKARHENLRVVGHGLATVDDVSFDIAHHGPSAGIRDWTAGNQLRYYLRSIIVKSLKAGESPPRLVVRGHFHELRRETDRQRILGEWKDFDIVLLPSYCGMGEYGRQATSSKYQVSNGMVAAEIVDGQWRDLHVFERAVDLRTREEF